MHVIYPQNGDRIVTTDYMTSRYPVYPLIVTLNTDPITLIPNPDQGTDVRPV